MLGTDDDEGVADRLNRQCGTPVEGKQLFFDRRYLFAIPVDIHLVVEGIVVGCDVMLSVVAGVHIEQSAVFLLGIVQILGGAHGNQVARLFAQIDHRRAVARLGSRRRSMAIHAVEDNSRFHRTEKFPVKVMPALSRLVA